MAANYQYQEEISESEEEADDFQETKRNFLNSFSVPQEYLEELKETKDENENDPFKDRRRKTIAEREDDYKARWRKRRLSPDRVDPFQSNGHVDEKGRERNSYRDVMLDVQLEKEKSDLIRKIQQKEKEKEIEEQRKLLQSKRKTRHSSRSKSRSRSRSRERKKKSRSRSRSRERKRKSRSRS